MPLPTIANVIRCSVDGLMPNNAHWANVLHVSKPGGTSYPAAITAIDAILPTFWTDHTVGSPGWSYYANQNASIQQVKYTPLDGSSVTTVYGHVQAGLKVDDALPPEVALVISLHTALRGRSYRGRIYLGGFTEGYSTSVGAASATLVGDMVTVFAAKQAALVAAGYNIVVASYKLALATPITSGTVDTIWDSQRGRRR